MYNSNLGAYLKEHGEVMIAPLGFSMLPLLKGDRCQVILKYPDTPPHRYDVVLYQKQDGKLILHRIIQCARGEYLIRGDHTYQDETGIKDSQILGVMTGFYRGKRYISCHAFLYRLYTVIWVQSYPIRKLLVNLIRYLRRKKK